MRDGAQNAVAGREGEEDALGAQPGHGLVRVEAERARVELDEVRLHLLEADGHGRLDEAFGEAARIRVVVREALDVVVEGIESRRGHDSCLTHGATEEMLEAPRLRHPLPRAGDEGPERAAEALREAERHGVGLAPVRRRRCPARHDRVHEPGAVEVDDEPVPARLRGDRRDLLERPHAPARAVVRVLHAQDAGRRHVEVGARVDRLAHLLRRVAAVRRRDRLHDESRVDGRPAQLVPEDVRRSPRPRPRRRARRASAVRSGWPWSRSGRRRPPRDRAGPHLSPPAR